MLVTIALQGDIGPMSPWDEMPSVFSDSVYSPKKCRHNAVSHLIFCRDALLLQFPFHSLPEACNSRLVT